MDDIYKLLCDDGISEEYKKKMVHSIPSFDTVDRHSWLYKILKDKKVLHFGGVGPLHNELTKLCDIKSVDRRGEVDYKIDVEKDDLPGGEYDYILCGEIIEHLSNPGFFLDKLRKYDCDIIITVPNAFCATGYMWLKKKMENVNSEHVAYYSYKTLTTLVERHGYTVKERFWYNGKPMIAEGLVFVVRK